MAKRKRVPLEQRKFLIKHYDIKTCLNSPSSMGSQLLAHLVCQMGDLLDLLEENFNSSETNNTD